MSDLWDIVSGVNNRLSTSKIPSAMGSAAIADIANDVIIDIEDYTGLNVDSGDIPRSMLPVIKNITTAYVLGQSMGVNVDIDVSVGNLRLDYGNIKDAQRLQMEFYINQANKSLQMLGRRMVFDYTIKTD